MPNYRTHTLFNLLLALPALILGAVILLKINLTLVLIGAGAFAYGTLFMSPDLDLARSLKRFSLRGLFAFPFITYSWFFRHRGLSHSLLLGTATRVLWLGLFILGGMFLIYEVVPKSSTLLAFYKSYQWELTASLCGLFLADGCHVLLDRFAKA